MNGYRRALLALVGLALILALSGCEAIMGLINPKSGDTTLSTLTVTADGTRLSLTPTFTTSVRSYTLAVPTSTSTVVIAAVPTSSLALVDGVGIQNLQIGSNSFDITVTAQDGTVRIYTITVTRAAAAGGTSSDATLTGLVPDSGSLLPVFSGAVTSYALQLPSSTSSVSFTATTVAGATVTGNGPHGLNVGPNVITILVTAQDGVTTNPYTVTVTRASSGTQPSAAEIGVPNFSFENWTSSSGSGETWQPANWVKGGTWTGGFQFYAGTPDGIYGAWSSFATGGAANGYYQELADTISAGTYTLSAWASGDANGLYSKIIFGYKDVNNQYQELSSVNEQIPGTYQWARQVLTYTVAANNDAIGKPIWIRLTGTAQPAGGGGNSNNWDDVHLYYDPATPAVSSDATLASLKVSYGVVADEASGIGPTTPFTALPGFSPSTHTYPTIIFPLNTPIIAFRTLPTDIHAKVAQTISNGHFHALVTAQDGTSITYDLPIYYDNQSTWSIKGSWDAWNVSPPHYFGIDPLNPNRLVYYLDSLSDFEQQFTLTNPAINSPDGKNDLWYAGSADITPGTGFVLSHGASHNVFFHSDRSSYVVTADISNAAAPVVTLYAGSTASAHLDLATIAASVKLKGDQLSGGWGSIVTGTLDTGTSTLTFHVSPGLQNGSFGFESIMGGWLGGVTIASPTIAGTTSAALPFALSANNCQITGIPFQDSAYDLILTIDPTGTTVDTMFKLAAKLTSSGAAAFPWTVAYCPGNDTGLGNWNVASLVSSPLVSGIATFHFTATNTVGSFKITRNNAWDTVVTNQLDFLDIDPAGSPISLADSADANHNITFPATIGTSYTIAVDFSAVTDWTTMLPKPLVKVSSP